METIGIGVCIAFIAGLVWLTTYVVKHQDDHND